MTTKKDANDWLREDGIDAFREHLDQELWQQIRAQRANGGNGNGNGHANNEGGSDNGGEPPPRPDIDPDPDPNEPPPHPGIIKSDYLLGKTKFACNVYNVLKALNQEPTLINLFAYDEMASTEMLMRPLFVSDPNFKPRPITDADVTKVQSWLQSSVKFTRLGKNTTHEAIHVHALRNSYHPVRNYLNLVAAKWDGRQRVSTWLTTYAGVPSTTHNFLTGYVEEVGKMFLVGMVARIYKPGCKFDYMPILEGQQGLEKSKLCETLVGEEYFSDQLPDISNKDASMHLRGKWLIEMAEMHVYTRAQISKYKEFMTRRIERYRPVWGHKDVFEPRTCAFIGSTNKLVYLRDETGNRRSWPLATGEIKIEALKQDRDQLWAEAVLLYRKGVHWWPTREFEREHIRPQQDARFEPDPWEPLIQKHLNGLQGKHGTLPETTILKIAVNVLGFTTSNTQQQGELKTPIVRLEPKIQGRITAVLHHLGWVQKHDKHGRWWTPGPEIINEK
jgi:predicted P-loop ATPase